MTPTEYDFVQEALKDLKTGLEKVRSEVHGNAISQGNALTQVSQKVTDLQDRLFLDSTSAIPRLTDSLVKLDERFTAEVEKENEQCLGDRKEMRSDIVSLRVKMAYVSILYGAVSSIAVTLLSLGLRYIISGHL